MSDALAKRRLLTVVCNERSGGGRAGRVLPKVARQLAEGLPDAELHIVKSTSYEQARDFTRAAALAAQEKDLVVVMGGDGMAHLGLNACAHTHATLGIIPAGTGNDFVRGVGIPTNIPGAVAALISGRTRTVDLAKLTNHTGTHRIGAVISSGYDARVNRAANDNRVRLGALSYGYIAVRELAHFSPLNYRIVLDDEPLELRAMLVAVCNTAMFGGGMRIAPEADPTDGLLDITIIHEVSRAKLLRLLPTVYSGKFASIEEVELRRARRVQVDGDGLFLMGDGEELGDAPAIVEADAGALRVVVA